MGTKTRNEVRCIRDWFGARRTARGRGTVLPALGLAAWARLPAANPEARRVMACGKPSQASPGVFPERLSARAGSVHFSLCHGLGHRGVVDVPFTRAPLEPEMNRMSPSASLP